MFGEGGRVSRIAGGFRCDAERHRYALTRGHVFPRRADV